MMLIYFSLIVKSFIVLQISANICQQQLETNRCSTSNDCACLTTILSSNLTSRTCAYLNVNLSKLNTCTRNRSSCDHSTDVCIYHPDDVRQDLGVCYPAGLMSDELCPPVSPSSNLTTTSKPEHWSISCRNVAWTNQSSHVAGSNFSGSGINQLSSPTSIVFDRNENLFHIGDNGNARIISWKLNETIGKIRAGDNGAGNRTEQFGSITDMWFNQTDGSLIICDARNRRIIRWSRRAQQGQIMAENIYCSGLAVDDNQSIYVSDYENHRIIRLKFEQNQSSQIIFGSKGKGSRLDQLNQPTSIFIDEKRTIYIVDQGNERILRLNDGDDQAHLVGPVRFPRSIYVDPDENVYTIDGYYNRLIRFPREGTTSTILVGEKQYSLSQPYDFLFDDQGNVFIVQFGNGRVSKFAIDRTQCAK